MRLDGRRESSNVDDRRRSGGSSRGRLRLGGKGGLGIGAVVVIAVITMLMGGDPSQILSMAGGAGTWRGTGGMATKLSAAKIAMESGCDMVITNGARMKDLYGIVEGQDIGTRFIAAKGAN